jgi:putative ATP-dependent endonuclease of OLD family
MPENNLLILVGQNNAGKSNIIRAVNNILGSEWWSEDRLHVSDYYMRDKDNRISITLSFDNGHTAGFRWNSAIDEYRSFYNNSYLSNELKGRCPCTYLGADRTFDRHMSFYDWTLLGKIRKTFNEQCGDVVSQLNQKFEDVVQLFDQVPGFKKFKEDFGNFFAEMQADTPLKMSVDFKPFTPSNYFKTMQIIASDPSQGEANLDLEELGEGTRNIALIALLRSYAANLRAGGMESDGVLALEEPEIYLHPQAQRNMLRILKAIAASGIQVIISTHSDCFIDTGLFDSIAVVRKQKDADADQMQTLVRQVAKESLVSHCIETGVSPDKTNVTNISEHYKTTSNDRLNEAFFARFIILVEGQTEELVLPEFLLAHGLDCDMKGVSVIAVEGKNQIPKYWRLFSAFHIPILVVFDNDNDTVDKSRSNKNLAACFDIKLDQILGVSSWNRTDSNRNPSTPLIILEKNFEGVLKNDYAQSYNDFAEFEADAKALIRPANANQGKGLIARHIVRKILATHTSYRPPFIAEIGNYICHVLGF